MSECFKEISNPNDIAVITNNARLLRDNDASMSVPDSLVLSAEQLIAEYKEKEQEAIRQVIESNKTIDITSSDELVAQVGQANTQPTETKTPAEVSELQSNKQTVNSTGNFARRKPKNELVFTTPITGENGNQVLSYKWSWREGEKFDKHDGGLVNTRVSDWDSAIINPETGKEIVHQFNVKLANGEEKTVSLETAKKLIGDKDILKKVSSEMKQEWHSSIKELVNSVRNHRSKDINGKLTWNKYVDNNTKTAYLNIVNELKKLNINPSDAQLARMIGKFNSDSDLLNSVRDLENFIELNKESDNKQKELTEAQKENFKTKIKNAVNVLNMTDENMNTVPYVSDINKTIDILDSKGYNEFADSLRNIVIDSGNESILSESKETQSSNDQANTDGQKTSQSDTFDPLKIKNTQTQPNTKGGFKLIDTDTGREVFEGRSFKTKSEGNKLLKKLQQDALSVSGLESAKETESTASQSLIEQHKGFFAKVNEGAVTVEQFKNEFESLVANKEAVEIELAKQTKDQLLKSGYISYYHKNEKKDFLVHQAYRGMLSDFFISDKLLSYGMGKDSYVNAIRGNVKEQTDAGLKDHSTAYKKAKAERDSYRIEALKGMDNPQTLEDYQRVIRQKMDSDKVGFKEARMT